MTTHPIRSSLPEQPLPSRAQTGSRLLWLHRSPLLVAAALITLICGSNIVRLVKASAPRDPWEATEVVEAWRSLRGMPVYDLAPGGHSTHMYGALVPWLQGEIFRWVGPNNVSGRLLSLVSALAVVVLLVATLRGERSVWYFLVAGAVILGANNRSNQYFAENRPDMTAMMFAAAGVLLLGLGQERRRGLFVALGHSVPGDRFLLQANGFHLRGRAPGRARPALAAAGSVGGSPGELSFGRIDRRDRRTQIPQSHRLLLHDHRPQGRRLRSARAARCFWDLLIDSPLFLVLLGECIVFDARSLERDPRVRWLFAVFAIAIPFSSIAAGKVGGASNSLLPALLAMTAFCVLRLPRLLGGPRFLRTPLPIRLAQGAFVALLMMMSTFPHMTRSRGIIRAGHCLGPRIWPGRLAGRATAGNGRLSRGPHDPALCQGIRRSEHLRGVRHSPSRWRVANGRSRERAGGLPNGGLCR